MSNTDTITAYKGNLTQVFTRKSWEILGSDKYGWELIPEAPKEIAALVVSDKDDAGESLCAHCKGSGIDPLRTWRHCHDCDGKGICLSEKLDVSVVEHLQDDAGEPLPEAQKEKSAGIPKQTRKSKKRR